MKTLFLATLFLGSSLYALNLSEIISQALKKKPSLNAITHRISASDSRIALSDQFENPMLSYSQNTIDTDQAMSKKTLLVSQKLPFYGKRDSLEEIALAQKDLLLQTREEAKVLLVQAIKHEAYTIWEFENQFKIIEDYEKLTEQNIRLYESYSSTSSEQHMGIMSATLTLSDLKIQKKHLESKITKAYAKLSYLSTLKVDKLDIDLKVKDLPNIEELQRSLADNKSLVVADKEIQVKESVLKNSELNNYPDFTLSTAYSYRENFDDYLTMGIGINLPIYAREDYKEEEARELLLASKSLKKDETIALNSELQTAYSDMKSNYEVYHIVHDEAIPQVEHMFELTSSSIATGGDLFKYIDVLIKKLKLEQKSILAVANYNRAQAKIDALSGEIE